MLRRSACYVHASDPLAPACLAQVSSYILALALLIAAAVALKSGRQRSDDWLPVTPEELKMTSEAKAPGAPAINLYRK